MKKIVKITLLLTCLFTANLIFPQSKNCKIQLADNDGNAIEYFLLGDKGTLLKSNSDGILFLTRYQLKKYKDEKFTLHFSNHLAYLVYRINLYYDKGTKTSDKHLKYNRLTLEKLTSKTDNQFYLRRKEIRLDDDENLEGLNK